ncbi:MAG: 3D domain-containing protein [Parcubacteria group bacterium]|nr:3D domain-containing protein [Parcubacteria group bacterium]
MYTINSKVSASFALVSLVSNFVFPQYSLMNDNLIEEEIVLSSNDSLATLQGQALIQSSNPDVLVVVAQNWVITTAYSSTSDQTDSTPFITASGTNVRDGIVACNFLKFGTRVRFPELYGDKIFIVEDRMAAKNNHKIDIWFSTRWEAKQFGVKQIKVEVLGT